MHYGTVLNFRDTRYAAIKGLIIGHLKMGKPWLLLLCLVPLLVAPLLAAAGGTEEEESVLGCGGFIQSARLTLVSSRNCL
jgi:hypothetical protein